MCRYALTHRVVLVSVQLGVVQEVKYNTRFMLGVYFLEVLGRIQYAGHMQYDLRVHAVSICSLQRSHRLTSGGKGALSRQCLSFPAWPSAMEKEDYTQEPHMPSGLS